MAYLARLVLARWDRLHTRMFRQRSGSSLCYACGKLNRVDASVCFYCGARRPGLWGFAPLLGRVVGRLDVARLVTIVCIVAYAASLLLDPGAALRARGLFDILAPGGGALYALGATGALPWAQGRWWTIFTAIYLHGSLLHILLNLMWVRQLAPPVEELFGRVRLVVIFILAGARSARRAPSSGSWAPWSGTAVAAAAPSGSPCSGSTASGLW